MFSVYMYTIRAVVVKDKPETSHNHCVLKLCLNIHIDWFTKAIVINLVVNSAQQFLANISPHALPTIYFFK